MTHREYVQKAFPEYFEKIEEIQPVIVQICGQELGTFATWHLIGPFLPWYDMPSDQKDRIRQWESCSFSSLQ